MDTKSPRLVIAYGNPGRQYVKSRSNVGYIVVDAIVQKAMSIHPTTIMRPWAIRSKYMLLPLHLNIMTYLVKPRTYEEKFDYTAFYLYSFYKLIPEDFYIVVPDKSLPLGEYEITKTAGSTLVPILKFEKKIENNDYWKIRVGNAGESEELSDIDLEIVKFVGEKIGKELELFNPKLVKQE